MEAITELTPAPWPPPDRDGYEALTGKDVYGAGGERLGTVAAVLRPDDGDGAGAAAEVGGHWLVVKPAGIRAWFGGRTLYVPEDAVSVVAGDGVGLAYPKRAIAEQAWAEPPAQVERVLDA